jgi:hypothetical protein
MKKEIFYLRTADPYIIEPCEPLIIWILRLNGNFLFMPELHFLVNSFYFPN